MLIRSSSIKSCFLFSYFWFKIEFITGPLTISLPFKNTKFDKTSLASILIKCLHLICKWCVTYIRNTAQIEKFTWEVRKVIVTKCLYPIRYFKTGFSEKLGSRSSWRQISKLLLVISWMVLIVLSFYRPVSARMLKAQSMLVGCGYNVAIVPNIVASS